MIRRPITKLTTNDLRMKGHDMTWNDINDLIWTITKLAPYDRRLHSRGPNCFNYSLRVESQCLEWEPHREHVPKYFFFSKLWKKVKICGKKDFPKKTSSGSSSSRAKAYCPLRPGLRILCFTSWAKWTFWKTGEYLEVFILNKTETR
jgi:hypothetical protein